MKAFEITVGTWLAREHGDAVARATLGQLELRRNGRPLTLLEDRLARSNRSFANLSAYDLAVWLLTNWWRLRWEPQKENASWRTVHCMTAAGSGYIWPNVTIFSDGEQVQVQVQPTRGREWEPIRYLDAYDFSLAPSELEEAVDLFLDEVLARLAACGIPNTELHLLWEDVRSERADPQVASIRKLEALLGLDAGAAGDEVLDELLARASRYGYAAVEEVAAGFGTGAAASIDLVAGRLDSAPIFSYESLAGLASQRESWSVAGLPWQRAAKAAQVARQMFNLNGSPVSNELLVQLVGGNIDLDAKSSATDLPMPAARWTKPERTEWRVALRSSWPTGRRFELCRLMADGLIAPADDLLLPATAAKTSRQKFQRAFAAEFLSPFEALIEYLGDSPDDEDIEAAAAHFQVSPLMIRTTLVHKGILPRDQIVDAFEDRT